jgi:hypothetical protein
MICHRNSRQVWEKHERSQHFLQMSRALDDMKDMQLITHLCSNFQIPVLRLQIQWPLQLQETKSSKNIRHNRAGRGKENQQPRPSGPQPLTLKKNPPRLLLTHHDQQPHTQEGLSKTIKESFCFKYFYWNDNKIKKQWPFLIKLLLYKYKNITKTSNSFFFTFPINNTKEFSKPNYLGLVHYNMWTQ